MIVRTAVERWGLEDATTNMGLSRRTSHCPGRVAALVGPNGAESQHSFACLLGSRAKRRNGHVLGKSPRTNRDAALSYGYLIKIVLCTRTFGWKNAQFGRELNPRDKRGGVISKKRIAHLGRQLSEEKARCAQRCVSRSGQVTSLDEPSRLSIRSHAKI